MKTINTYLPCFDGFYGTIWEPNEDNEIDYINSERKAKGWEPAKFIDFKFDYSEFQDQVVKGIINYLENEMKEYITNIDLEGIVSPKEYNFRNDSANVTITLSNENINAIETYFEYQLNQVCGMVKGALHISFRIYQPLPKQYR